MKAEDGRVEYSGLHSLQPWDVDDDGVDELLASQRLTQGKTPLADIGVVWKRRADGEGWEALGTTIMTLAPAAQGNTVNDGAEMAAGTILPRRLVVRGGESTIEIRKRLRPSIYHSSGRALMLTFLLVFSTLSSGSKSLSCVFKISLS